MKSVTKTIGTIVLAAALTTPVAYTHGQRHGEMHGRVESAKYWTWRCAKEVREDRDMTIQHMYQTIGINLDDIAGHGITLSNSAHAPFRGTSPSSWYDEGVYTKIMEGKISFDAVVVNPSQPRLCRENAWGRKRIEMGLSESFGLANEASALRGYWNYLDSQNELFSQSEQ